MRINPKSVEAYMLFHNGTLALARAEQQGIRIDMEYAEKKKQHLTRKIEYLQEKFKSTNAYKPIKGFYNFKAQGQAFLALLKVELKSIFRICINNEQCF